MCCEDEYLLDVYNHIRYIFAFILFKASSERKKATFRALWINLYLNFEFYIFYRQFTWILLNIFFLLFIIYIKSRRELIKRPKTLKLILKDTRMMLLTSSYIIQLWPFWYCIECWARTPCFGKWWLVAVCQSRCQIVHLALNINRVTDMTEIKKEAQAEEMEAVEILSRCRLNIIW